MICSVPDCPGAGPFVRGWCRSHYERWRLRGDPLAGGPRLHPREPERWLRARASSGDWPGDCVEWPFALSTKGYGLVMHRLVTHVVLELSGQPRPEPPANFALHSCDNPPCFNVRHLRWGSRADNHEDMRRRGRRRDPAKTTLAHPLAVRRVRLGLSTPRLAELVGCHFGTIARIEQGGSPRSPYRPLIAATLNSLEESP